jgi:transcriptional regulator with XRE-family HTH domain
LNETLRRALLRAQLTEEDVAAHLEVDPKTVRRWLEGRVPYLRHRWALAVMLGLDETDLWPQTERASARPIEVRAIYPHCADVPMELWRSLFRSAKHDICILADDGLVVAEDSAALTTLGNQAGLGVRVRICLPDPNTLASEATSALYISPSRVNAVIALCKPLAEQTRVQIRLHSHGLSSSIYRADEECMVVLHAYGIPASRAPVVRLSRISGGYMFPTYIASFERLWAVARPPE